MQHRSRILGFGLGGLLVVAGVVCGAAIGGETGGLLATILGGLGLVEITALIFMEVGLSEDRELAREARAREREERKRGRQPRPARRLERLRGERRRLP